MEIAAAKYEYDSIIYERQLALSRQGVGTAAELDTRKLSFEQSKKNKLAYQLRHNELLRQLELNQKLNTNNQGIALNNLENLTIKSKIDGIVFQRNKKVGEYVSPTQVLALVGGADDILAQLQIDEEEYAKIRIGQEVYLELESQKGKIWKGRVSKVIPIIQSKNRTFTVEAVFWIPYHPTSFLI